jgi:hypothetical protein
LLVGVAVALLAMSVLTPCGGHQNATGSSSTSPSVQSGQTGATTAALRSGERFQTIQAPQPYTPSAPQGGTDEYRCFLIDPHLTKTEYLTGSQFIPQNTKIVHHAIIFRIDPSAAAAAQAKDAADPGEGWTCFGDTGLGGAQAWVATWAPGMNETLLAANIGYEMPPGSLLVMQIHYNLLATGGKPGGSDQSSIRLRLRDPAGNQMTNLQTKLLEAPIELPCTSSESGPLCDRTAAIADVAKRFGPDVGQSEDELVQHCDGGQAPTPGSTQSCDYPVRQGGTIYALAGHMHLLGKSISVTLNPGTANSKTLLNVPLYNFDNQAIQPLATPVTVKPGDTLRVTCTHDASLRAKLPALQNTAPRYVVWGDGTSDEMCLGLVIWTPSGS